MRRAASVSCTNLQKLNTAPSVQLFKRADTLPVQQSAREREKNLSPSLNSAGSRESFLRKYGLWPIFSKRPSIEEIAGVFKKPLSTVAIPTALDNKGRVISPGHIYLESSEREQKLGAAPAYGHSPDPDAEGTSHTVTGTLPNAMPFEVKAVKKPAKPFNQDTPRDKTVAGVQVIPHGEGNKEQIASLNAFTSDPIYETSGTEGRNCVHVYKAAMECMTGKSLGKIHPFTTPQEMAERVRDIRFDTGEESEEETEP